MMLHVDSSIEKIGQFLFPGKYQRYLTFRLMTVFGLAFMSVNFALSRLNRSALPSEITPRINRILSVEHSPVFACANVCS
jgi:hypothetical protein